MMDEEYNDDDAKLACALTNRESQSSLAWKPIEMGAYAPAKALTLIIARLRKAGDRPCSELLAELRPDPHREAREKAKADAREIVAEHYEGRDCSQMAHEFRQGRWDDGDAVRSAYRALLNARNIPEADNA